MAEQDFIKAGFTVVGAEKNENKLLSFLKENYPNVIKDNEINLNEVKAIAGLAVDEKINGYGLNFVGRNFARAKYAQKTEKELRLNSTLSKNLEKTENLILKGDNLDALKILKNHYSGQIKCIYIDPPYNTDKDEFVYPDKFDKEEAEVLGLANLSENDYARMDFIFKTKKSHNGWLSFMYPRLLLARDLLSKQGVIFISIDDNEQANLKLLCDDIFGEENFVECIIWNKRIPKNDKGIGNIHEYVLLYVKDKSIPHQFLMQKDGLEEINDLMGKLEKQKVNISDSEKEIKKLYKKNGYDRGITLYNSIDNSYKLWGKINMSWPNAETMGPSYEILHPKTGKSVKIPDRGWRWKVETFYEAAKFADGKYTSVEELHDGSFRCGRIWFAKDELTQPSSITYLYEVNDFLLRSILSFKSDGGIEVENLFDNKNYFSYPKPTILLKTLLNSVTGQDGDIVLDFFAGSGTTGHAVMQLNAGDGGNRKFILCQIDEPINKDKPAYQFCIDNNLPPVISSITIERLKRAGEKTVKELEEENKKAGLFEEQKKQIPDLGFKVFDSAETPKLKVDEKGQISITENGTDALSRIYNMIFTVGLDEPTQVPEEVVKDCIYKIGNHYYINNSDKITSDDYANAIKNGKVFIDGWTASLNGTLQNYKEDVKIVF
jgi:adenine-specific DNA-methyltransferase